MYYNYKKQRIKSVLMITLILAIAIIATHHIYYKFQEERNIDYSSSSLDITFHEETADHVTLTKITPVTDAVGLSSKAYTFTIQNNMTKKVNYTIRLVDDIETITTDNCSTLAMPKNIIRIAIREDDKTEIYTLSDLPDNILKQTTIDALDKKEYSIRLWTTQSGLQSGTTSHYHGKIEIKEREEEVAIIDRGEKNEH